MVGDTHPGQHGPITPSRSFKRIKTESDACNISKMIFTNQMCGHNSSRMCWWTRTPGGKKTDFSATLFQLSYKGPPYWECCAFTRDRTRDLGNSAMSRNVVHAAYSGVYIVSAPSG
jgi:hypothetical protein